MAHYGTTRGDKIVIKAFASRDELVAWVEAQEGNAYVLAEGDLLLGNVDLLPGQSATVMAKTGEIVGSEPMPEAPETPEETIETQIEPEPEVVPDIKPDIPKDKKKTKTKRRRGRQKKKR